MYQAKAVSVLVAMVMIAGIGCRKPAKLILTKDQRVRIQENILKEAPKPKYVLNANFGDNIKLIGMDLSADKVRAGETMTVTYYWECLKEVPGEWKVFVHLELPAGKRMILDHHPMGELYPIRIWKKGDIVKDVQRFAVAADTKSGTIGRVSFGSHVDTGTPYGVSADSTIDSVRLGIQTVLPGQNVGDFEVLNL